MNVRRKREKEGFLGPKWDWIKRGEG